MTKTSKPIDARRQYAAARHEHYTRNDLRNALELYQLVMATHPDAPEAGYARTQIRNIVNVVVAKQDYFRAQVELASAALVEPTGRPK